MIQLYPNPNVSFDCPHCEIHLDILDWYIPGMRVLAKLRCPKCSGIYFGDFSVGQALYSPMLLEKETGQVTDPNHAAWFSDWLKKGYRDRSNDEIGFTVHQVKPVRTEARLILLNCLDVLYGHCVLKLLNAQYYLDHCPDMDLVVMVPSFLKWMVPDGVTAIWEIDWQLKTGYLWNEWLAEKIRDLAAAYREVFISAAYSHPHPQDYEISRFVGVQPFEVSNWEEGINHPRITFIWRADRLWAPEKKRPARFWRNILLQIQTERVTKLANKLRAKIPGLEFTVTGMGTNKKLPGWIIDLRTDQVTDSQERQWCKLYAESHVVIGVHGSNMLIPSSLAGAVIDLMPNDRWGNILQDILFRRDDLRESLYRHRFIPLQSTPDVVANIAEFLLFSHGNMMATMSRNTTQHLGE